MRLRTAKKLHNRDEVLVRTMLDGTGLNGSNWEEGYVLGEPQPIGDKYLSIPVQSASGFRLVGHLEVR
jgi:hypothetical protein